MALLKSVFLFVISMLLLISLFSYNINDPNLNQVNDLTIQNYAGFFGSCLADLLFQVFGISSYLLGLVSWFSC